MPLPYYLPEVIRSESRRTKKRSEFNEEDRTPDSTFGSENDRRVSLLVRMRCGDAVVIIIEIYSSTFCQNYRNSRRWPGRFGIALEGKLKTRKLINPNQKCMR